MRLLRWVATLGLFVILAVSLAAPAHAVGTGTYAGFVRAANTTVWDRLLTLRMEELGSVPGTTTGQSYETQIDTTSGAFAIDVPAGDYRVFLKYTGTGNFISAFSGGGGQPGAYSTVTIVAGQRREMADAVFPGGSISGRLTGEGGPIATGSITVTPQGSSILNTPRVTLDSATGIYVIDRLEPRNYSILYSGGSGFFPQTAPPVAVTLLGEPVVGKDIDLVGRATIAGTVTLPVPLGHTEASLYRDGNFYGSLTVYSGQPYEFTNVSSGTYTVKFGYGPRSSVRDEWWPGVREQADAAPIVVSAGMAVVGIDASMELAPDIVGEVRWTGLDGTSDFWADAIGVTLLKEDPSNPGTFSVYGVDTTAYDGRFAKENLEPGRYIVQASGDPNRWFRTT